MNENVSYEGLLPRLRFNLRENPGEVCCACAAFTDQELLSLLEKHGGDVDAASYEGLLIKARSDAITLPDGLQLPDGRGYWLALARLYRPAGAHNLPRADEVKIRHVFD
jgi:hypothetical protein